MKITKKQIKVLSADGITIDSHHATIKKAYQSAFGSGLDKEGVQAVRDAFGVQTTEKVKAPRAPKAPAEPIISSDEDLIKSARSYLKEIGGNPKRVLRVTEQTAKGNPARVVVACADPQTTSNGDSVCDGEREVAIQDVFQVRRCESCQKRSVQLYRNRLARARRAELAEHRKTA